MPSFVGLGRSWVGRFLVAALCLVLGVLLVVQLRTQQVARQSVPAQEWEFVVADLVESNGRLREEIAALSNQVDEFETVEGGGGLLQSLVDEVNYLRIVNGQVAVAGPGIEVTIEGNISVLDLHDLINELRNAGAEALALNGGRIVAWSAIGTDGEHVTVDGRPVQPPYHLQAIGDAHTLEVALLRPGGLVELIQQFGGRVILSVERADRITLPVYEQPFRFAYARPVQ